MNKAIIIIILILIVGAGAYFVFKGSYQSPAPNTNQNNNQNPPVTGSSESTILIKNFSFNPSTLNIKAGDTVIWTNQDPATHKIKSDTFNSGDLNQGDTFRFTFNSKGTYDYVCAIHPSMTGKIIVE